METPPVLPSPEAPKPGNSEERQWIIITHLSALAGFLLPSFGQILGPLIVWLIKKNEYPGVDVAGRSVLNFQISWTIYAIVSALSWLICIGMVLLPAVLIGWFVFFIIGAVKASNGESYAFPLTIKFL
jgi:uncharacterized protein